MMKNIKNENNTKGERREIKKTNGRKMKVDGASVKKLEEIKWSPPEKLYKK